MTIERVLIVRLSALGDTALTLPLAVLLKRRLPELRLGWAVGEAAAPLLEGVREIDRLHVWHRRTGLTALLPELRAEHYQAALDPQGISRSALVPWLARIPLRVGMAPGPLESRELSPWLLNRFVAVPPQLAHLSERSLQLVRGLDLDPGEQLIAALRPVLHPDPSATERVAAWLRAERLGAPLLVMGLGAGWPTKIWPASRVRALAAEAQARGFAPALLWGPQERSRLHDWQREFRGLARLAPTTNIQEMLALLAQARAYAGPDSAPLHLAWLLGKPTFSWFGASDPARCAPRGAGHAHVAQGPHHWRRNALLGNPIARLSVAQVRPRFAAWLAQLAPEPPGAH